MGVNKQPGGESVMATIKAWHNDLCRVQDLARVGWQPVRHQATSQMLDAAALSDALLGCGNVTGWVIEPSQVRELRDAPLELAQRPLSGEFFDPHAKVTRRTWQLAHQSRDRWSLVLHELSPCDASDANALAEPVSHAHVHDGATWLHYWRLWQPDVQGAPACHVAVLVGLGAHNA